MSKLLFVYPNKEGYPIIPLGISILSGILKNAGHKVELFDVTFMVPTRSDHDAREKTMVVKKVDVERYWGKGDSFNIEEEFRRKMLSCNPDLIAFSVVENNYGLARRLFKVVREISNTPIIVGGVFPTVATDFFVGDKNIDIICIGEGEYSILELANRLDYKKEIFDIPNLIIKSTGKLTPCYFAKYYDWEPFVFQDWDIFDERHLFKPLDGKMWRTGLFEMSRGCPFKCSYCANHIYQGIFKDLGIYHREKPIKYVIEEIEYMKNRYSLELVFFIDENFMMMSEDRFAEFCLKFKERIKLPFFIQTKAETLLEERKVGMLKDANCITIGIGVESGNEKIRSMLLRKPTSNHIYKKAFNNCNKYKIRTTAYIMIGLPFETEEEILESINFCKELNTESIALSIFAPYHGSELYDLCVKKGFIEDKYNEEISVNYSTILNMPQISKKRLEGLYYNFNSLVFNK